VVADAGCAELNLSYFITVDHFQLHIDHYKSHLEKILHGWPNLIQIYLKTHMKSLEKEMIEDKVTDVLFVLEETIINALQATFQHIKKNPHLEAPKIKISLKAAEDIFLIAVEDSGLGINLEQFKRQTKEKPNFLISTHNDNIEFGTPNAGGGLFLVNALAAWIDIFYRLYSGQITNTLNGKVKGSIVRVWI
jgi:hypothetical protein